MRTSLQYDLATQQNKSESFQLLSEDRSEYYARVLTETHRVLSNRSTLIVLLQDQLVKMEELYKTSLEKHSNPWSNKTTSSLRELRAPKSTGIRVTTERENIDVHEGPKTEHKSLVDIFENPSCRNSNVMGLSDITRSLQIKSMRSKIEDELFKECQVNFGGPNEKQLLKTHQRHKSTDELDNLLELQRKIELGESQPSLTSEDMQSQVSVAIERKQQDIDVTQIKIQDIASELENANRGITKCVYENRTLLEDYELKLEHFQQLHRSVKDENGALRSKMQKEKDVYARENEYLESVIRQKEERLNQLQRELVEQEKEKEITEKCKSELEEVGRRSQESLMQKDSIVAELRESLNEAVDNAKNPKEIFEMKLQEKEQNFKQMAEKLDNTKKMIEKQAMEEKVANQEQLKALCDTVSQQKEQLAASDKKRVDLVNEIQKLQDELKTKTTSFKQKDHEVSGLRVKVGETKIELVTLKDMNAQEMGEKSISAIKEKSLLKAYEELITEKDRLQSKLIETEYLLITERRVKTEVESELLRYKENEKTSKENLTKILPEFLGEGEETHSEVKTQQVDEHHSFDAWNKLGAFSKELENARIEKRELIRKGKKIFYHYEMNISKLKSDYGRVQNETLQIRSEQQGECCKTIKEEARQLKERQEAYSKKLSSCLKELSIYKDDVNNWMEAYDKVVKQKLDLETEIKILINNVLHKDEAIKEVQNKFESVTKESAKLIMDCETKYNELNDKYEDTQKKLAELKASKDEVNEKIIRKDKDIRQYEERVDAERNENARLNRFIGILQEKIKALANDLDAKEKQFNIQIERNKSALLDLAENYEKAEIEYDYLKKQQEDVTFYKTENINLIRDIEGEEQKIESLKSDSEELEKELSNMRTEMELQNSSASLNLEELKVACAKLEKKLELTKYALKKQECQAIIRADEDIKDLQGQIVLLKEKLDCKNQDIQRLSEQLKRAQKDKAELDLHVADTIRELEREIDEVKSSNRVLRQQIIDRFQQEAVVLKRQLREANTQKMNLEADVRRLGELLQGMEEKCAGLKTKNEKLQADIAAMDKELSLSKSWITENVELQAKLDKIESELFMVKQQCSEMHEQLNTTKTNLTETQKELCLEMDLENVIMNTGGIKCSQENVQNTSLENGNKINKNVTVLYNNMRFTETNCVTAESAVSNVLLAKGSKVQKRLASLDQMEKEVEEMILAVQQQNEKLKDWQSTRIKNEKESTQDYRK